MGKATMATAVRETVNVINGVEPDDRPLKANMPQMLNPVFKANLWHLLERSKVMTNVTCMQPMEPGLTSSGMSYILGRQTTRSTITLVWMGLSRIALEEAGL